MKLKLIAISSLMMSCQFGLPSLAVESQAVLNDKESAKNSNIAEAQKLNGSDQGSKPVSSASNSVSAKKTADVVNAVPGVKVQPKDLQAPDLQPIKGFHPIKKLLRPVENLEGMSIKLEQQIMKLEGPIAALNPPMVSLQKGMVGVDHRIGNMAGRLDSVQGEVTGVRADLSAMRKQIDELKQPIKSLQGPISDVATPLEAVQRQLNYVLIAIVAAAIAIAFGTPLAAVLVYRFRHKIFPDLKDHELVTGKSSKAVS